MPIVKIKFTFLGDQDPTLANLGDVLKSFLTILRFYVHAQEIRLGKKEILIHHMLDPPFTAEISVPDELEDIDSTIHWMHDFWDAVREDQDAEIYKLLGSQKEEIERRIGISLPPSLTNISENLRDELQNYDYQVEQWIRLIKHVDRAKNWEFHLVNS